MISHKKTKNYVPAFLDYDKVKTPVSKNSSFIRALLSLLLGHQFMVLDGSCNISSLSSWLARASTSAAAFPAKKNMSAMNVCDHR
jgi:hypothetical protein